jgi:hypothetical protein
MSDEDSPFTPREPAKPLPTPPTTVPTTPPTTAPKLQYANQPEGVTSLTEPPDVDVVDSMVLDSLEARAEADAKANAPEVDEIPVDRSLTGEDPRAWATSVPGYGMEPSMPAQGPGGLFSGAIQPGYGLPRYTTSDPLNILNSMNASELAALELQFIDAGYPGFDIEEYVPARDRSSMISVFTSLVNSADHNRQSWQDQLEGDINYKLAWDEAHPDEKANTWAQDNPWPAPSYLAPDYATLAQTAKATVRGQLGRNVTSGELTLLTGFMNQASKDAWKANEYDLSLSNWESRARAHEDEANNMDAATVQGVDAVARFGEMFDERYSGELEHRRNVETVSGKQGNLFGSIDALSRMSQ